MVIKIKFNINRWKEIRNNFSRSEILYYWTKYKLEQFKLYCFRLWFKFSKYEHKHVFIEILTCSICRKSKMDIDRERLKQNNKEDKNNGSNSSSYI